MNAPFDLRFGDCLENMRAMPDNSVDSIVTDPPYELGFMGKGWDATGIANNVEMWREALRVLKPGGHLLAFSGSRTYHRMACAIEDAGFEVRDRIRYECGPETKYGALWDSLNDAQRGAVLEMLNDQTGLGSELAWEYGSGFPKSHSVHKAILPMVESRYGKEKTCDCVDCGNGRPSRDDAGRAGGQNIRLQRVAGHAAPDGIGDSVISIDTCTSGDDLLELRGADGTETPRHGAIQEAVLLDGVRSGWAETQGFGNVTIRAGMEEQARGDTSSGQGVQMLRQDAGDERGGAACPSLETISRGRHESADKPSGALRSVSSPNRGADGTGFIFDFDRRDARRTISDDQCGWATAVAHVCTWCGKPDGEWLDSLVPLGTALKPAHEPICVARKPLVGTVAANVLAHGTGALNIDGCRVRDEVIPTYGPAAGGQKFDVSRENGGNVKLGEHTGRWPANLIHDGSDDVLAAFPSAPGQQGALTGDEPSARAGAVDQNCYGTMDRRMAAVPRREADKSAARFFYCAKASKSDRGDGNTHPTVKPTDLMAYLCRLVTPPGGLVLDMFMGSGTTGKACMREGFRFVGLDITPDYMMIAAARIGAAWREAQR